MRNVAYVIAVGCAICSLGVGCGGGSGAARTSGSGGAAGATADAAGGATGSGGAGGGGGGGAAGSGGSSSDGSAGGSLDAGGGSDAGLADGPPANPDVPAGGPPPGDYGSAAPLLEPNSEMAVTALDGKVYVLGGYPSSRETQRTLQIFDTARGTWSRGAPHPIPIHHPVTAGVNGKLYSLGGQRDMTAQPDTNLSFVYDPAANTWAPLPDMPTARGGGGGAIIGTKIYVVGGRPPAGNAFEVFDVAASTWATLPKLPVTFNDRNHLAAAAIGDKIYVAGGRYDGGSVGSPRTASLDMFDPATNMWTAKKPLLRVRGGMSGVAANGCFFVYGGEGSGIGEPNDVYPDHDVYNPVTDTWTALKPLPRPFHGVTGGAFVDGIIYMPGGGTSSGGNSGGVMHQTYRPAVTCQN